MQVTLGKEKTMSLVMALFAVYTAAMLPMDAFAGDPTPLSNILCTVVGWFTGPLGSGLATIAVIVIGIGALMGKVSWGMAIIVGIGIGVIFGAPTIVSALGGGITGCAVGGDN